jgi:heme/copper-type cytochrome/quinol oxidase subunit 2
MPLSGKILAFVSLGFALAAVGFGVASPWANAGTFATWAIFVAVACILVAIVCGAFALYFTIHYDGLHRPDEKNPPKAH